MINVHHLITELSTGGAQRALLALLQHGNHNHFGHSVVCLYNGDAQVARQIRALRIPVTDLGFTAKWRWDAFGRFYCHLRQVQPVILHCWMFHANLVGRITGHLGGMPIVITSRRNAYIGGTWREYVLRMTANLDDRVITPGKAVRSAEIHRAAASPEKVVTIPNGIDTLPYAALPLEKRLATRRSFGIPGDASLAGTVGRLHPQKGHQDLLYAMRRITDVTPAARLLIVGDGAQRSSLEELTRNIGLDDKVIFGGLRSDVPELLASLDVFVLASHWEGMPNAVLEAMAARLPVVATAVGGTPEVVVDGETGLLVPPRDPQALAQAIRTLFEDPERARAMGRRGRERVAKHFDIRETVRRTEDLYEELLREKGLLSTVE